MYWMIVYSKKCDYRLFNFIAIGYILFSMSEHIIHKKIMHCDRDGFLYKLLKNNSFLNNAYNGTCDRHIAHHLEVLPNMNLIHPDKNLGLFADWDLYLYITIIIFVSLLIAKYISNYNISILWLIIISLIISFLWSYLWNKTHAAMHSYADKFSIYKGPYDEGLVDTEPIKNLLYENHKMHHLQKGEKKGNYSVIVLGADEWFNKYNIIIDNKDYCNDIQHKNEKICMEK